MLVPPVPEPVPVPPVPVPLVPVLGEVPPVAAPVPDDVVPPVAAPVPLDADGVEVPADEVVDGLVVDGVVLEAVDELELEGSAAFWGASRSGVDLGTRSCVAELPPQAARPPVRARAIATAVTGRRMAKTVSPPRARRAGPCAVRTWGSR